MTEIQQAALDAAYDKCFTTELIELIKETEKTDPLYSTSNAANVADGFFRGARWMEAHLMEALPAFPDPIAAEEDIDKARD